MGYTLFEDHFYLIGGFQDDPPSALSQFYSLDLSTSWAAEKAPWTRLRDGPALSHLAAVSISTKDFGGAEGSLLLIGGAEAKTDSFFSLYSFGSSSWSTISVPPPYPALEGHAAVMEPSTGKVHIFGGYATTRIGNENQVTTMNRLTVYDHVNKVVSTKTPAANDSALAEPGAVWLSSRKSFILFGGSRDIIPAKRRGLGGGRLDEYDPSKQQWKTFVTTGSIPPDRADHCMAANEDGSKVVVFGGSDMDTFMADIYILDVASAKWTKGPDAPKSRIRMACAIYKNQLIVVGGSEERRRESMHDSTPVIFNLNSNHWSQHYSVDGSDDESGGGGSMGGIIGGVVAAAAIGAVAAFFVLRKRRARRHENAGFSTMGNASADTAAGMTAAAVPAAGAGATGSFHEFKHDGASPPGNAYSQDIQLGKLNNNNNDESDPFADQYNPNYAATHYGYASPQLSAYNGGATSYAASPAMGAISSPAMQAEYLNHLRHDEPVSNTLTHMSSNSGGGYGTTPLLPPQPMAAAHLSNYSHESSTEYHQAYFASNPYNGGANGGNDAYGQAGYGYGSPSSSSYPAPPGGASPWPTPSAHSKSPQDYTNYVPPNGMPSPSGQNSGYVPPPL
ncbi:hypothetical protein BGZ73_008398 [Actinomortierella ambigua]|nr:hypothetical protein BGZ73_008398 [Actinomortierella ambigua]